MKLISLNLKPLMNIRDWTEWRDGRTETDIIAEFRRAYSIAPELAVACVWSYMPAELEMDRRLSIRSRGMEAPERDAYEQSLWDIYFVNTRAFDAVAGINHCGCRHGFPFPLAAMGDGTHHVSGELEKVIEPLIDSRLSAAIDDFGAKIKAHYV